MTAKTRKPIRDRTPAEAVAEVERLDAQLAKLRPELNALTDRAVEVSKEIHQLKTEHAEVIAGGDPDLLADDTLEARVEQLEGEQRRIRQSVDKKKSFIRRTELNRMTLIGLALDHYDAELADEEAALARERDELLPLVAAYSKSWASLYSKRRKLVDAHRQFAAAGSHILGRRAGDIPEAVELRGVEPPDVKAYQGKLPHIRLESEKS